MGRGSEEIQGWARGSWSKPHILAGGIAAVAGSMLAACSTARQSVQPAAPMLATPRHASHYDQPGSAETRGLGRLASRYKLGNPYRVGNVWYVPREEPGYDRSGTGSWYGADFHGRTTANGEIYDMNALTAAHPTLPLPSYLQVTNLANGRTILVRLNDRGPYVAGRLIDLSRASARALGYEQLGTAHLRVRYAGRAPLDGDITRERDFLAAQPWSGRLIAQAPMAAAWGLKGPPAADGGALALPPGTASWSTDRYRRSLLEPAPH